jgi:succinoglycan biosynthesis transport protein ExoP
MSNNYELMPYGAGTEQHRIETVPVRHVLPGTAASPGKPAGRAKEDLDFDLHSVLHAIIRRQAWMYASTAAMLAAAALVCIFMTPQYQAESTLEILKQTTGPLPVGSDGAMGASSDPLDFSMSLQTQLAVLNSDTLAWKVIKELKLLKAEDLPAEQTLPSRPSTERVPALSDFKPDTRAADLLKQFKRNLTVASVSGTRLMRVSYLDSNPQRAADIVNQLVSDFVEYTFRVRYDATNKATDWLGRQLVELKSQVEQAQNRAAQLERQSGIFGEDEHHNIVLTRLEQLNNELTSAEADRVLKESIYRLSRSGDPDVIANLLGSQSGASAASGANPATLLNSLRQQEATIEAQYADAAAKYGPAYPRLIQIKDQLNSVRGVLAAELAKVSQRAKSDYELSVAREASARNAFTRQKAIAAEMNDKATNYLIAKQEAESSRRLYQHLLEEVKEAGVLAGLHSSDLHVVDLAAVPIHPARPNTPLYLAAGTLAGMLVGLVCVFAVESTDRTVRDVGEIEASTFVPVFGVIPQAGQLPGSALKHRLTARVPNVRGSAPRLLESLQDPAVAEAFRSVRTSLLLSRPETPAKVLLVTSGLQQEGKTFTSLHLAAALARKGGRVLLVDADLRRATLSRVLRKDREVGLSQALLGEVDVENACHSVEGVSGLTLMAAGRGGAAASGLLESPCSELLESPRMAAVIQSCREQFAYIVLDTPPVLLVTDAVVLSPKVDAVLVVVRFANTSRDAIVRTIRLLKDVHPARVGVLVNEMDIHSPEYYCYSGSRGYDEYRRGDAGNRRLLGLPSPQSNRTKESA